MIDTYLVGYASGIGGRDVSTGMAPLVIEKALAENAEFNYKWLSNIYPATTASQLQALEPIGEITNKLGLAVQNIVRAGARFGVIGGDHSSAIGTWQGAQKAFKQEKIGLIWLDAHLDAHTPESSESGNIHGMPVATLLGEGSRNLTQLFGPEGRFSPEQIIIIGARDYEAAEEARLQRLGVRVYTMTEVNARGLSVVMHEAVSQLSQQFPRLGVSLDLDVLDPEAFPAVTAPAPHGLALEELINVLQSQLSQNPKLCGIEVVEYHPALDPDTIHAHTICNLINTLLSTP